MKIARSILCLLIVMSSLYSQSIHFYVYPLKGNRNNSNKIVYDIIKKYTGTDLRILGEREARENPDSSRKAFFTKLTTAMESPIPPDLFFVDFPGPETDRLIEDGKIAAVDHLLKQFAPAVYAALPPRLLKYRERTGDVYSIPIRKYNPVISNGFWLIEKKFLKENDLDIPESPEDLDDVLSKCGKAPKVKSFTDFGPAKNVAIYDQYFSRHYKNRLEMAGFLVPGSGYTYLHPGGVPFRLDTDEQAVRILEHQDKIQGSFLHAYDALNRADWACAHFALRSIRYNGSQVQDLIKLLYSDDYVIFSELEYVSPSPVVEYNYLYIPAASKKIEETLAMLNVFHKDPQLFHNLLTYGVLEYSDDPAVLTPLITESVYYSMNPDGYPLSVLIDNSYMVLPDFIPDQIHEDYSLYRSTEKKLSSHPLYGFDYKAALHEIALDNNAPVFIQHNSDIHGFDRILSQEIDGGTLNVLVDLLRREVRLYGGDF